MRTLRNSNPRGGFTLIEILAVIMIVGILATILITQLSGAEDAANAQNTQRELGMLEAAIDAYRNREGDAPRSSFNQSQGVANDGENVGIEALVVALWSGGNEGGELADFADKLVNTDGDASSRTLTDFGTRGLLEIPDAWGNPLAYFHRRDYEDKSRRYRTYDPVTGEELTTIPVAFRNPITGRFFRHNSYQLISAGSDARFGTEDDITTFDRD